MKVVVVDPWCSNSAAVANEWVPIRPGTDAAVMLAMMNVMVNELGLYDEEFLRTLTNAPYLVRNSDGRYVRVSRRSAPRRCLIHDDTPKCHDNPSLVRPAMDGEYDVDGHKCVPVFVKVREHFRKYTPRLAPSRSSVP